MTKHTPGPWKLAKDRGIEYGAIYGPEGLDGPLVATTGYRARAGSDEDLANARLIAAAPEMLEALKAAQPFLRSHRYIDGIVFAAIAKAEGETK